MFSELLRSVEGEEAGSVIGGFSKGGDVACHYGTVEGERLDRYAALILEARRHQARHRVTQERENLLVRSSPKKTDALAKAELLAPSLQHAYIRSVRHRADDENKRALAGHDKAESVEHHLDSLVTQKVADNQKEWLRGKPDAGDWRWRWRRHGYQLGLALEQARVDELPSLPGENEDPVGSAESLIAQAPQQIEPEPFASFVAPS